MAHTIPGAISADMVLMYMRDELDPDNAARVENAIDSDALPVDVKSQLCGSFKAAARNLTDTYEMTQCSCRI